MVTGYPFHGQKNNDNNTATNRQIYASVEIDSYPNEETTININTLPIQLFAISFDFFRFDEKEKTMLTMKLHPN